MRTIGFKTEEFHRSAKGLVLPLFTISYQRGIGQLKALYSHRTSLWCVNEVVQRVPHDDPWINVIYPYPCRGCVETKQCTHSILYFMFSLNPPCPVLLARVITIAVYKGWRIAQVPLYNRIHNIYELH